MGWRGFFPTGKSGGGYSIFTRLLLVAVFGCVVVASASLPGAANATGAQSSSPTYDWLQFGGNPQHPSDNTLETTIGASNVSSLQLIFRTRTPTGPDNSVVYLSAVSTPSGVHDLIFTTTQDGHILALDAHTGKLVWSQQYGPGSCTIVEKKGYPCFTTAAPAIDPNRQYVYTRGVEGYIHKLQVGDGTEIIGNGWPELVTLTPSINKGSASLTFATARSGVTYLYAATSGFGGYGDDGHVTAINLTDGSQHLFNNECSDQTIYMNHPPTTPYCSRRDGGVWGRSGVLYSADTDRIYEASGNGWWDPANHMWGDSVLALNPDGTGINGGPLDNWTPTDQLNDYLHDIDVGSSAPVIVPVPPSSPYQHVAVQFGKDAKARLLNLDDLNGHGGPGYLGGEIASVSTPEDSPPLFRTGIRSTPSTWVNPADQSTWFFITDMNALTAFRVTWTPTVSIQPMWRNNNIACQCHFPDGNPTLVANGVLYIEYKNNVQALNPLDGTILWQAYPRLGVHWNSPVVVNGVLYVTDQAGHVLAYAPSPSFNGLPELRESRSVLFNDYSGGVPFSPDDTEILPGAD